MSLLPANQFSLSFATTSLQVLLPLQHSYFDHSNFLNSSNSKVLLSFADVGPTTRKMIIGLVSQSEQECETPTDCYTVGWNCALQEEYECCCRMLDEEYSGPEIENQDDKTYAYGRIAKHYGYRLSSGRSIWHQFSSAGC